MLYFVAISFLAATSYASIVNIFTQHSDGSFAYTLDDTSEVFYVPSQKSAAPVATYPVDTQEEAFIPFTVLALDSTNITAAVIQDMIRTYGEDDVWNDKFLKGIQVISTGKGATLDASALSYLQSISKSHLLIDSIISCVETNITTFEKGEVTPSGPYLGKVEDGVVKLFKTYGTFSDEYASFMTGITAQDNGSYSPVHIWHPDVFEKMIPVPSRLYSSLLDPAEYPLAGLRFAIKDIIDVAGIPTSGGSSAYLHLYNHPRNKTAPAMQKLIDLGATPIGKTKTAPFAWGEWPDQNDDIPYPWNARGDGYLGLSASSHGSASALAAYDYVDFVIGTDTGGSVRNPADRAGVYGLRPSWGTVDVEGVITSAKTLDAVGFMARDPLLAYKLSHVWFGPSNSALQPTPSTYPKKIFYPSEWFPLNNSIAQTLVEAWLSNMTTSLNMSITYQNTSKIFQDVIGYNGTLADWTTNVSSVNIKDNWDTLGAQFVSDYASKHAGRYPARLDTPVRDSWAQSPTYTQEYYDANVNRSWEFTSFWNDHVVPPNEETCTDALWIYHIADTGGGVPEYRDRSLDYFPDFPGAMRGASIAPFAHTVDVTVPIGQIAYQSVVSQVEEVLPITLNFVAHRGCDWAVLEWMRVCAERGFCRGVKTGRRAF